MSNLSEPAIDQDIDGRGPTVWRVGTLVYDRRALINVFVWMLWGDFCLYLMDAGVGNNLILLQLRKYGASNTTIAVLKTTVVELLIVVLCPIVSTWSDRHRSRLGRRIPFMLYATPLLAVFLALVGLSPAIADRLKSLSPHFLGGISAASLTIALLTLNYTAYKFCDIFPQSVYYYLWADVIPSKVMGTFTCLFRVISTLGVLVFNKYLLKYCDDHPAAICIGAAGLYMVSFLMLCLQVKEGHYPPPPLLIPGPRLARSLGNTKRFFKESFSHVFYWKYYLCLLCFNVGFVPFRDFLIFYGKDIKLDLGSYGNIMAIQNIVQTAIYLCLGPLVDRLHPLRAGLVGYSLLAVSAICGFAFIHSISTFRLWVIVIFGAMAIYQGATTSLGPRILPAVKYGQFSAASALVFHFGQMLLVPIAGLITDRCGNVAIFPWLSGFSVVGTFLLYLVYRDWKKLGGDDAYVAPLIDQPSATPLAQPLPAAFA
jgi:maltose/moltooligosaccharide transporter